MPNEPAFDLPDFSRNAQIAAMVPWPRCDRTKRHQGRADLAAQTHQSVIVWDGAVTVVARVREAVAPITGPAAADLEKLVSDVLAERADEHPLRQHRVRTDHHGLIVEPDFSGLARGELATPVGRLEPR